MDRADTHDERRRGTDRRAPRRLGTANHTRAMLTRIHVVLADQPSHPAADQMLAAVDALDRLRQARDAAEQALREQRAIVERLKEQNPFDPDHADWQAIPAVEIAAALAGLALAESAPYDTRSVQAWLRAIAEAMRQASDDQAT